MSFNVSFIAYKSTNKPSDFDANLKILKSRKVLKAVITLKFEDFELTETDSIVKSTKLIPTKIPSNKLYSSLT